MPLSEALDLAYLKQDLGGRLTAGRALVVLKRGLAAALAKDAIGTPLFCEDACLCLLRGREDLGPVVVDGDYLAASYAETDAAEADLDMDPVVDEAAAHAALSDVLAGAAGTPEAHVFEAPREAHRLCLSEMNFGEAEAWLAETLATYDPDKIDLGDAGAPPAALVEDPFADEATFLLLEMPGAAREVDVAECGRGRAVGVDPAHIVAGPGPR